VNWEELEEDVLGVIADLVDFLTSFWVSPEGNELDLDSEFVEYV